MKLDDGPKPFQGGKHHMLGWRGSPKGPREVRLDLEQPTRFGRQARRSRSPKSYERAFCNGGVASRSYEPP